MKKILPLMIVVLLIACNKTNTVVDEKFGFKDLKLESSLAEVKSKVRNLIPSDDPNIYLVGDSTYYILGNNKLAGLTLRFFNNQLMSIHGLGFQRDIKEALLALYGKPSKDFDTMISWEGEKARVDYSIGATSYSPFYRIYDFADDFTFDFGEEDSIIFQEELAVGAALKEDKVKIYGSMSFTSNRLWDEYYKDSDNKRAEDAKRGASDL